MYNFICCYSLKRQSREKVYNLLCCYSLKKQSNEKVYILLWCYSKAHVKVYNLLSVRSGIDLQGLQIISAHSRQVSHQKSLKISFSKPLGISCIIQAKLLSGDFWPIWYIVHRGLRWKRRASSIVLYRWLFEFLIAYYIIYMFFILAKRSNWFNLFILKISLKMWLKLKKIGKN